MLARRVTPPVEITAEEQFWRELVAHGHFLPSGEPGLYGRGAVFEHILTRFDLLVSAISRDDHAENLRFPPFIPRRTLERAGYLGSFPQLCGAVFGFRGSTASALAMAEIAGRGEDWSGYLQATNVTLVPAACYPSYPAIASRGPLPEQGVTLDLGGCYVFRNEPSNDPARLQVFHQRELVRIGSPEQVSAWREVWIERAKATFEMCGIKSAIELASDPFFGRQGKLMANSQREQGLKFEALVRIASSEPTAVASFNLHQDHFGAAFGIARHDGGVAHSACVGFGLERITLALFRVHGLDVRDWPADVQEVLWPHERSDKASRSNRARRSNKE